MHWSSGTACNLTGAEAGAVLVGVGFLGILAAQLAAALDRTWNSMSRQYTLDEVVNFLNRRQLRATYGAVADVTGGNATFLMNGIERAPRYSWIVNQETLLPTGYAEAEYHTALLAKKFVLMTGDQLRDWLARPDPATRAV